MASITDYVKEGLKYPFNDIEKLLCFGVLFAALNLLTVARSAKSLDILRAAIPAPGNTLMLKLSHASSGDIYLLAALAIISFVVMILIMGYQYNVVKFSIDKKDDLPGFRDFLNLLVNGIKYFIVSLAYSAIPIIVFLAGMLSVNESYGPVLLFISIILSIIAYFLLIMALNNMVAQDKLAAAFDFNEITGRISSLGWGKYVGIILFTLIVFLIVMIAAGFIVSFISILIAQLIISQAFIVSAVAGIIEGLFVTSYGSIFFNRVLGSVYRESLK